MTTKHTPGPWMATPRGYVILTDRSADIANVTSANGDDVMMANASLIAAAPDLLAALEYIITEAELNGCRYSLAQARAAIAKARGG